MTMIAKMLKRKVSRVTTEAPDLNAVAGAPGSGGDPTQQTQAPDAASHRGHRDSEGLQRAASVSLPLQYRQVFVAMISISNEERSKTQRLGAISTLAFVLILSLLVLEKWSSRS